MMQGMDGATTTPERFDGEPTRLPVALTSAHRARSVGDPLHLVLRHGDPPGRPSGWHGHALADVVAGAGFTVERLVVDGPAHEWLRVEATRGRTLPDTVGPGMRVLLCGLNPSVHAAEAGYGFAGPSNRFWAAATEAELVTRERDPEHALAVDGIGMTDVVKRATPRAAMIEASEYAAGMARVERLVSWLQPGAVCFVGLAGWRAVRDRRAQAGVQSVGLGGRPVYLMPSTSGLNARVPRAELVDHLRAAAAVADAG